LDMATSGLMVFARTKAAHRALSIQFQKREIAKRYEALLDGVVAQKEGCIELPFRLDIENRPRQIYDPEHGKWGITRWRCLGVEEGLTRIEFTPETGRTHQLRLHSAHERGLGVPIVGDMLYGTGTDTKSLKLHAKYLAFRDPTSGKMCEFESTPPF
ncbi:MAG: RluA family pseudouridine synthase, partial [Fibrobacterota bacterium]